MLLNSAISPSDWPRGLLRPLWCRHYEIWQDGGIWLFRITPKFPILFWRRNFGTWTSVRRPEFPSPFRAFCPLKLAMLTLGSSEQNVKTFYRQTITFINKRRQTNKQGQNLWRHGKLVRELHGSVATCICLCAFSRIKYLLVVVKVLLSALWNCNLLIQTSS